jgi:hypothetical protein
MSCLSEALKLVERNVAVFPCGNNKKPLTKNGFKDAATDAAQVKEWWRRSPNAMIGVPTGERFVVVDCDLQHNEALRWYEHGNVPLTRKHVTKSGGRHLLFRPDDRVGCSAGKIWPHIDTRGKGGYIIWWPAEGFDVLHGGVLAEVPPWIIERFNKPAEPQYVPRPISVRTAGRKIEGIVGTIATARPGERNGKLFWGANRLKEVAEQSIISHSNAFELAIEAASRTGLSITEAHRTVASAFRDANVGK